MAAVCRHLQGGGPPARGRKGIKRDQHVRKRYALVGTGSRARLFTEAIAGKYAETSELAGFCDTNQTRMDYTNRVLGEQFGLKPVPTFKADRFDEMVCTVKPDVVIVTSIDRTHHEYIIRAMEMGCDVITEKPMTIDAEKCQTIVDAVKRTGRNLRVAFNYRYAPHNTMVRKLLREGTIGEVYSVHFEWLLDTSHGADYFRRWHREKKNSGGLLVHKSTHHFDLVNHWLGTQPEIVFAMGDLRFYGHANASARGEPRSYRRSTGDPAASGDPFALDLSASETLRELYLNAEHEDGYLRDQNVFGEGIDIEDTMAVMVRYANRAVLTYSLNAYMPWEGFNVAFNGSRGRIELEVKERSYVNAAGNKSEEGAVAWKSLRLLPMHGAPLQVEIPEGVGGHGGGDDLMLENIFGAPKETPDERGAGWRDGAMSILTGIAANRSIATGQPVRVADLVRL